MRLARHPTGRFGDAPSGMSQKRRVLETHTRHIWDMPWNCSMGRGTPPGQPNSAEASS